MGNGMSAVRRRWELAEPQPDAERRLVTELDVSPLLARLLANRGLTDPGAVTAFLGPRLADHLRSPLLFRDMSRAAERAVRAIANGEQIGIYGDYDVDGISGSAILIRFFRALNVEPLLYVPHRLRDGYGLTERGIRQLASAGARVIVTVDCGGASHREITLARDLGIDVIVCDHHQVSDVPLPAHAVLNPIESDAGFPFRGLCGAGVAFYLALGIRMRLREMTGAPGPDLRRYLDLVALGTIADLVPLVEENRVLVKYGLRELERSGRPGIVALKTVSGVRQVSASTVGFRLAPRLNAGGRLADAGRSVELLTTDDQSRAAQLAAVLDGENRTRQSIEQRMLEDAVQMVETSGGVGSRSSIVLASDDWHPGVVGIVAARLVERYYRPTVLIACDVSRQLGRGSGRSISGLNLYEVFHASRDCLEGFGGHRMAAGLTIRPDRVPTFAQQVEESVKQRTRPEDFAPVRTADCELRLREIDEQCFRDLDRLEPHGPANREPVFFADDVQVRSCRLVGGSHLRLTLEQDGRMLSAIGFGMIDRQVEVGDRLDLLHSPMINHWNGTDSVELRLRDLRPHRSESSKSNVESLKSKI